MSERGGYVPPEATQKKPEDNSSSDGYFASGGDSLKSRHRTNYTPYGSISPERPVSSPEFDRSSDVSIPQLSGQGDDSSQQSQQDDATGGSAQSDATANPQTRQQDQSQQQDQTQQAQADSRDDLSHLSPEDREKYDEALANIQRLGEQAVNHTLRPGE